MGGGCLCQWELKAPTDRSRSDCVHEQVAKLGPVSRAAGMDCEYPCRGGLWIDARNARIIMNGEYNEKDNKFKGDVTLFVPFL